LARSLVQAVSRDRTEEDGERRRPERPEARQRMVPRHSADEVSADRQGGQQGPQRWQGGEKKACGALGFLPDWEEPRHDGTGTVALSPGGVNGFHEPFTPRLQPANSRGAPVVVSQSRHMTDRTQTNRWLVLVIVCVAQFMVVLDATIVNVALPSIQLSLHFSAASLQWIVNAYTLVFGGFLLLGGRAADLFGRQRLFIAGIVVFTGASLLNAVATSSGMLVGGRALQGLGAALVSPAALSIVTTTFEEGAERTKALGVWSAIAAGGGAVR